ncbi:MAG: hypothetical protein ACHQTE_01180 [Candidatus Saccharimonadales bacterium]
MFDRYKTPRTNNDHQPMGVYSEGQWIEVDLSTISDDDPIHQFIEPRPQVYEPIQATKDAIDTQSKPEVLPSSQDLTPATSDEDVEKASDESLEYFSQNLQARIDSGNFAGMYLNVYVKRQAFVKSILQSRENQRNAERERLAEMAARAEVAILWAQNDNLVLTSTRTPELLRSTQIGDKNSVISDSTFTNMDQDLLQEALRSNRHPDELRHQKVMIATAKTQQSIQPMAADSQTPPRPTARPQLGKGRLPVPDVPQDEASRRGLIDVIRVVGKNRKVRFGSIAVVLAAAIGTGGVAFINGSHQPSVAVGECFDKKPDAPALVTGSVAIESDVIRHVFDKATNTNSPLGPSFPGVGPDNKPLARNPHVDSPDVPVDFTACLTDPGNTSAIQMKDNGTVLVNLADFSFQARFDRNGKNPPKLEVIPEAVLKNAQDTNLLDKPTVDGLRADMADNQLNNQIVATSQNQAVGVFENDSAKMTLVENSTKAALDSYITSQLAKDKKPTPKAITYEGALPRVNFVNTSTLQSDKFEIAATHVTNFTLNKVELKK